MLISKKFLHLLKVTYEYRAEASEIEEEFLELLSCIDSEENKEKVEETFSYITETIPGIVLFEDTVVISTEMSEKLVEVRVKDEIINRLIGKLNKWLKRLDEDKVKEYRKQNTTKCNYIDNVIVNIEKLKRELIEIKGSKKLKDEMKEIKKKLVDEEDIQLTVDLDELEKIKEKKHKKQLNKKEFTLSEMIELGFVKEGNTLEEMKTRERSTVTKKGYVIYDEEEMSLNEWVKLVRNKKTINAYENVILVDSGEKLTAVRERLRYILNVDGV